MYNIKNTMIKVGSQVICKKKEKGMPWYFDKPIRVISIIDDPIEWKNCRIRKIITKNRHCSIYK